MSTHNTQQTSTIQIMPSPEPQRSSATKPLMIVFAVIGGATLLAILLTTVFLSVIGLSRGSATMTADTTGVTGESVDYTAAELTSEFGDATAANPEHDRLHATSV